MDESGVHDMMPIERYDNADDLERVILVIVEWIAQICEPGHEVHYVFCIKRILYIDRIEKFQAISVRSLFHGYLGRLSSQENLRHSNEQQAVMFFFLACPLSRIQDQQRI